MELNESYWSTRYANDETGWDIGYPSTPLKEYIEQLSNKDLKILIPGAGNGHEAGYLYELGFTNTYILDISENPILNFQSNYPDFPSNQIIHQNFFEHTEKYDLVLEQTFFCALEPKLRSDYVNKMREILNPNGNLVGLLFTFPLTEKGPPFGGSREEYAKLFESLFSIQKLERAYNSIKPREGNELFFKLERK